MNLNDVHKEITKNKPRRRLGRGSGSGYGKTAGRGHKGQASRSGASQSPIFQGGAMPLVRRIPKRGFNNRWAKKIATVNVGELNEAFAEGETVTIEMLQAKNLAKGRFDLVKVLGDGELTKKLTISAHRFSKTALEKIERSGGKAEVVPGPTPVAEKKQAKSGGRDRESAQQQAAPAPPAAAETSPEAEKPAENESAGD